MAEQIPYGVVVSVINRLGSLAFREIAMIYGVKSEIERLKDTVEAIEAVLIDAEQKQQKDKLIQLWIRKLKQVLYKADDLLDELHTEDLLRKSDLKGKGKVLSFFSSSNPLAFRLKVAHKIKKIREQFSAIAEDVSKLNLDRRVVVMRNNMSSNWRETCSSVNPDDIVGRENSKKEVINLLLNNNSKQNVSSIAIVGIGGLGKTALAQLVYNDAEVKKKFTKQMWVCVSEEFDVKRLVKKILESLKPDNVSDRSLDLLQNELQQNLSGQRYLLVLDDVWNQDREKWLNLKNKLTFGLEGSKILVTTRDQLVARSMGVQNPYILNALTNDQSWNLLKKLAFEEDTTMTQNMESIGRKIADKCGGIPLAVRAMGSLLYSKTDETDWEDILEGDFWKLSESNNSIIPILKLSYDHLSVELRQCFAYCSLYPKDWEYSKDDLIKLWMAQGYLECQNDKKSPEDVGEQYVHILLMRSFFQDVVIDEVDGLTHFKIHDLMHDLSLSVASPLHVNFAHNSNYSLDSLDGSRLRTIIAKTNGPSNLFQFKHLRTLRLSGRDIIVLPDSIGKMKHLRYLNLSCCFDLTSLPESISNLVNLQTLELTFCSSLEFSIDVVTKMISLRHLHVKKCGAFKDGMPIGLGKLTTLQSLSHFTVADNDCKEEKAQLNELKELNLRNDLVIKKLNLVRDVEEESKDVNLKAKKHLKSLGLRWGYSSHGGNSLQLFENLCPHPNLKKLVVEGYPGVKFPSWISSLTNLVDLKIYICENCQILPALGGLVSLKSLQILQMDALEYICYEGCSFPSLERLTIFMCENLKGWKKDGIDDDNHHSLPPFPRLSDLEIVTCPNLSCMPTFPNLVQGLALRKCSMKPLMETLKVSTTQELRPSLSMLKYLDMNGIEALPVEWMQNLTSLERLAVDRLQSLVTLLHHMQHLPATLETFDITDIENLDPPSGDEDFGTQFQALQCLRSLQDFSISSCGNLKALPEWICNLQSLQSIDISRCQNLESLPEGMHRLSKLHTLDVYDSSLLAERCKRGSGAEWPKIAHIPNIFVNRVPI